MSGFTDRVSQGILNHIVGKTAIFSLPTAYVGLFTAVGSDAGSGFTEPSTGGYARAATAGTDWNSAAGSAPSSISNANAISFGTATAGWGNIIAIGLFDAVTAGNLQAWDFFGNYQWLPATVSAASPAVLTVPNHGFAAGDLVEWTLEYGGSNPTFSSSNFTGILTVTTPVTANTFTVTNSATPVNTSAVGNGQVRKLISQNIASGSLVSFPAGSLVIQSS